LGVGGGVKYLTMPFETRENYKTDKGKEGHGV